ncbi:FAD-dependent oxidoreductase [Streptomyces sp. NPDC023327]|uniref:NAD(P)/FAD-dependent oxidoreductase n=1 Tax=Streptomyces sp. NPDC023327 TaxID=3157088 RepID=UPI0033E23426
MSVDVAVAGNGVLGLSIALELVRRSPGLRVTVVGPTARPGAATVAAGAMLNCFAEVTDSTGHHPASQAKFALARAALDAWPHWLEGLYDGETGTGPALVSPGTFVVLGAQASPTTTRNFDAIHAALKEYAEPHHEVEGTEVPGLRPVPNERPVRALYLEREGAVDARAVLAALESTGRRLGVTFLDGQVSQLLATSGKVSGMRLADGTELAAGAVVVAAGCASQPLLEQLVPGRTPPLLHGIGFAVETVRDTFPGFERVIRTPTRSSGCGMHLVPLGGGVEYVGATNVVLFDPPPGPRIGLSQSLLRFVIDQFDIRLGMSAVQRWHYGSRPVPLDRIPLLGPASTERLFVATGTYRDGFHSSPVIARHLADLILSPGTTPKLLTQFAPERAPVQTMSVEASIDLYVSNAVETAAEYGLRVPWFLDTQPVAKQARHEAAQVLESLAHPLALYPDIIGALRDASPAQIQRFNTYLHAAYPSGPAPAMADVVVGPQ